MAQRSRVYARDIDAGVDNFVAEIIETGVAVVNEAGLRMTLRAKHYAPVRRVFAGMRRGAWKGPSGVSTIPMGLRRQLGIRSDAPDVSRRVTEMSRNDFESMRNNARAPRYRADMGLQGDNRNTRRLPSGNANSMIPVFKQGNKRIQGDFRRVENGRLVRVATISREVGGRSRRDRGTRAGTPRLLTRGRYELKTGRSVYPSMLAELSRERQASRPIRGLSVGGLGTMTQDRLGGRLRGEIRWEAATVQGSLIQGWVVSPTEYARFQEFGTSRNRPHPYLRPALYEAKSYFPRMVRSAIKDRA